jgi:hypothetical protein
MKSGAESKSGAGAKTKSETTGSGASADQKSGAGMKSGAGPATTGAGSDNDSKSGAGMRNKDRNQATGTGSGRNQTTGAGSGTQSQTTGSASPDGGAVNLTSEQKTKIRTTIVQSGRAPKVERSQINFQLNVGTAVPRSIKLVAVPPTLVEIHPAWRGYLYFVVADEIIVVHPRTHEIVAVLVV